jgi:hypothetical protein
MATMMRRTWPIMVLMVLALGAVLSVLIFTSSVATKQTRYRLSITPQNPVIAIGRPATFAVQVDAVGSFHGTVSLAAASLPPAMQATWSSQTVTLTESLRTQTVQLTLRATGDAGPVTISVLGRDGDYSETGLLMLTTAAQ